MKEFAKLVRTKFAELPPVERVGLVLGIVGLLLCDIGLLLAILHAARGDRLYAGAPAVLLGRPFSAALEMLLYLVGAGFLAGSAFLSGRDARLLQIQECALVLSGIIFFTVADPTTLFVIRLVMFLTMFVIVKFGFDLAKGPLNVTGFSGTECLNWGYLFNSSLGFGLGGLLLAAYNWVRFKRSGNWVNGLFLILNLPFAAFAFLLYMAQCMRQVGAIATLEIFIGFLLFALVSLVTFIGLRFRRFPLEGIPALQAELAADSVLTMFIGKPADAPFVEVAGGHLVSARTSRLLTFLFLRLLTLRARSLNGTLGEEERDEYERLSSFFAEANRFVLDLVDHHQPGTPDIPEDLLRELPEAHFVRQDHPAPASV